MSVEETIRKVNDILKNDEEYKDDKAMQVQYILLDKDKKIDDIVCYGWSGIVSVDSKNFEIDMIAEWAYSYDTDLFEQLKDGKTIGYMTADSHYDIWCRINEWYPEDIDCKEGLDLYIKYCDENGITKDYLDKKIELDTPNIMDNFMSLEVGDILEYKGYIASAAEPNIDNDKENIIYIYKNKQDYINGEYIESASLNKDGIKKNIKEYIDENYSSEINKSPNYESEKAYFTFILGYDLLQDIFKNSTVRECDSVYDFCNYEAEKFLESNEYQNLKYSSYEMLTEWVEHNMKVILDDYKKMTNGELNLYNGNMKIIDKGFRGDEIIALVEQNIFSFNRKEYIIAFNYTIDKKNNNLTWGYGYYYGKDIVKAENDFKKVLNGGYLTDTFKQKENSIIKSYECKIEPLEEYPYKVRVLNSIDNGKSFYYTGEGKNLKTKAEMKIYISELNAMGIHLIPNKISDRGER